MNTFLYNIEDICENDLSREKVGGKAYGLLEAKKMIEDIRENNNIKISIFLVKLSF